MHNPIIWLLHLEYKKQFLQNLSNHREATHDNLFNFSPRLALFFWKTLLGETTVLWLLCSGAVLGKLRRCGLMNRIVNDSDFKLSELDCRLRSDSYSNDNIISMIDINRIKDWYKLIKRSKELVKRSKLLIKRSKMSIYI